MRKTLYSVPICEDPVLGVSLRFSTLQRISQLPSEKGFGEPRPGTPTIDVSLGLLS